MNIKTASILCEITPSALRSRLLGKAGQTIELPRMGICKISKIKNSWDIQYFDEHKKTLSRRDYIASKGAEKYSAIRDIGEIPAIVNPARRKKCSRDLALFLNTYLPESFYLPWSADHLKIIKKIETAIFHGGLFAMAMPRGSGKTTMVEGSVLFATLYGHRKYVVPIGAGASSAESILESIKSELDSNELLLEDFPEVCFPFQELEGVSLRSKGQTYNNGIRTHIELKANKIVFPTIAGSLASGVIINPKGITGHMRGLKHKNMKGEIIRPDFCLLDDPQDDESSNSISQCDKREKLINGAVLGLAGHKKKIAAVMPCTIIEKNDLAARMLNREKNPDWQGETCKLIYQWPETQETMWKEYAEIRKIGIGEGDNGHAATEFYKNNREVMDKGSIVAWEHRKYETELSALQHAENLLLERGESAFYAEFQNDPIASIVSLYEITAEIVASRLNYYPRNHIPPETQFLTAGIDINTGERGINWVVSATCNDLTSYIIDYGRYPEKGPVWQLNDKTGLSEAQAVYSAIIRVCDMLINQKEYIKNEVKKQFDGILVDCGYMTTTVFKAAQHCNRTMTARILPSRGRAGKQYKPTKIIGSKPGENFHKTEWTGKGNVIIHNADVWKMQIQKAFLLKPQAPGSISLYGKDAKEHRHYAENICCEVLSEFVRGDISDYYNWNYRPGFVNDLLDATIMAEVAAGVCGASNTGGETSWRSKQPVKRRKKAKTQYYEV